MKRANPISDVGSTPTRSTKTALNLPWNITGLFTGLSGLAGLVTASTVFERLRGWITLAWRDKTRRSNCQSKWQGLGVPGSETCRVRFGRCSLTRLRGLATVLATESVVLFTLGCTHNVPTPPPTLHGAIITIEETGAYDHFVIYRGLTSCSSMAMIATVKVTQYKDSSAPVGTTVCYMVTAVNEDGPSMRSNPVSVLIPKNAAAIIRFHDKDAGTQPPWSKK